MNLIIRVISAKNAKLSQYHMAIHCSCESLASQFEEYYEDIEVGANES